MRRTPSSSVVPYFLDYNTPENTAARETNRGEIFRAEGCYALRFLSGPKATEPVSPLPWAESADSAAVLADVMRRFPSYEISLAE